jgi:membrane-associated protein
MELIHWFIDIVLHLDRHLVDLLTNYGIWIYAILFLVIFAETGFVVTPFLPGDSLLFAAGALAAIDTSGTLSAMMLWVLLSFAGIAGNSVNYSIGKAIGAHAFSGRYRLIKVDYLRRTERWFESHGALTIVLSRFAPIIRTFAPFVAGIGHMPYGKFQLYNIAGGVAWVGIFIWGGYLFGNLPVIKQNFGFVTIGIVVVSLLPMAVMLVRERFGAAPPKP